MNEEKKPKANIKNKKLEEFKLRMEAFFNDRLSGDIRTRFIWELNKIYGELK